MWGAKSNLGRESPHYHNNVEIRAESRPVSRSLHTSQACSAHSATAYHAKPRRATFHCSIRLHPLGSRGHTCPIQLVARPSKTVALVRYSAISIPHSAVRRVVHGRCSGSSGLRAAATRNEFRFCIPHERVALAYELVNCVFR